MGDGAFLKHIPLNRTVLSYQSTLKEELLSWLENASEWIFLTEEGWFEEAFSNPLGKYIWTLLDTHKPYFLGTSTHD